MKGDTRKLIHVLAQHIAISVDLVLFGGGAMTLAYRSQRATEDLDILVGESQLQLYAEQGLGEVFDQVNRQLEPMGLYIRHLWSPLQEVLTQNWEQKLVHIDPWWNNSLLQLRAISPLDMIASKLVRFDDVDREDIRYLIAEGWVQKEDLQSFPSQLLIPIAWETEANKIKERAKQLAKDDFDWAVSKKTKPAA